MKNENDEMTKGQAIAMLILGILASLAFFIFMVWISEPTQNDEYCMDNFPSSEGSKKSSYSPYTPQTEENHVRCCRYKLINNTYEEQCLTIPMVKR